MLRRRQKLDWDALSARIAVTWRPDPHRRGGALRNKKLYQRKPRTPSGASHFWGGTARQSRSTQALQLAAIVSL